MNFFGADDATQNPFEIVQKWMEFARRHGEEEVDAVDLATVDQQGMPNLRIVYIREYETDGFVFYTNYHSRKGEELLSAKAAFNMYFKSQQRQIRVRGEVEKVSCEQSDRYYLSRPDGSRLGAWVSQQSQPLSSREKMMDAWKNMDVEKANTRPEHWGGYRIRPLEFEFWKMGEFRLHDRFRWVRESVRSQKWEVERLYP